VYVVFVVFIGIGGVCEGTCMIKWCEVTQEEGSISHHYDHSRSDCMPRVERVAE